MKKIISVLIVSLVVFSCLFVPSYAKDDNLKIMVSTDTHFKCIDDCGRPDAPIDDEIFLRGMENSEIFGYASQQGQLNHESTAILRVMLDDFINGDDEYLLIGGDLTCGYPESHKVFASMLKDAEKRSGKEIFVITGNHDCGTKDSDTSVSIDTFKEIYKDFGYSEALSLDTDSASYTVDLNDDYRLIAIDSCIYGKDDGEISNKTINWIKSEASKAKDEGKNMIAMMHHSVLPHFALSGTVEDNDKVAKVLADSGIKYVFTGHMHANDISVAETKNGNTIYDIQTGCLIASPNAYRHVSFSEKEVNITSAYVTSIDTNLLPEGYTKEQIEYIKNDFTEYSYKFFESGICRWLNRYVGSAVKLGKTLKMTKGTLPYNMLDGILQKLGDAMALPIYDDGKTPDTIDSLEEIAALSGAEIPESEYTKLYQVAAAVMGSFYHGDEPAHLKTVEVPLFLTLLKAGLSYAFSELNYGNDVATWFDNGLNDSIGFSPKSALLKTYSNIAFSNTIANDMVDALFAPLLQGLSSDYSEPGDINVTLDGYGCESAHSSTVPINFFDKLTTFFKLYLLALFD